MQQTIQPNFLLFDFTANAACYVCCKLSLTFVQFLVLRDIEERGRDLENVLFQYTNLVKPAFEEFCMPVSIPLILTWHLNMFILGIFKYAFQLNYFLIIICRLRNTLTLLYPEELITRVTIFILL